MVIWGPQTPGMGSCHALQVGCLVLSEDGLLGFSPTRVPAKSSNLSFALPPPPLRRVRIQPAAYRRSLSD
jgi:hypothetical protein